MIYGHDGGYENVPVCKNSVSILSDVLQTKETFTYHGDNSTLYALHYREGLLITPSFI